MKGKVFFQKIKKEGIASFLALSSLLFSSCKIEKYPNNFEEKTNDSSSFSNEDNSEAEDKLKKSFLNSLLNGIALKIDNGYLNFGGEDNKACFNNAELKAQLKSFSLHGLNVSLDMPINYRGKQREAIISSVDEWVYMDLENIDNPSSTSFKYKINIKSEEIKDENNNSQIDSSTGGIYYYQYGKLSYVFDEIMTALDLDSSISLPSEGTSVSISDILESLDNITRVDSSYYHWDLPIGEKNLPIGLKSDNDGYFSGLDLPYKGYKENEYSINEKVSLKIESKVTNEDVTIKGPANTAEYLELQDSLDLIKDIAVIANKKKFSITTNNKKLKLTHFEKEVPGTSTTFKRDEINEDAYLSLDADIDFSTNSLNDMFAKVVFECNGKSQQIAALKESDDIYINFNNILCAKTNKITLDSLITNIKNAFSSNSSTEELDSSSSGLLTSLSAIKDAMDAVINSPIMTGIRNNQYDELLPFIASLKSSNNQIDIVLDLSKISGTENAGTLSMSFSRSTNSIALLQIDFNKAKFASFTLEGTLLLDGFILRTLDNKENYVQLYHLESVANSFLNFNESRRSKMHLKGYVLDESTSSVYTSDYASSHNEETYGRTEQGFTFDANFAIDLEDAKGSGILNITDRKADYINDHQLKIDVEGKEKENENDLTSALSSDTNAMLVEYNSKNRIDPNSDDGKATKRIDPSNKNGIKAAFSIHSLNGIISTASSLLESTDPRFERLTSLFSTISNVGLIKLLQDGKYLELIATSILKDEGGAKVSENEDVFVIKKGILLNSEDLTIKIGFDKKELVQDEDGNQVEKYGTINSISVESTFDFGGENKKIVKIELNSIDTKVNDDELASNFKGQDKKEFSDYSSVKTMLEFLLSSATLGSNKESDYTSTYHLNGNMSASIIGIDTNIEVAFDFFISLQGAEVKVLGKMSISMITGVNSTFYLGTRHINFYYHVSGENDKGLVYYDRWDDGTGLIAADKHYEGKFTGDMFAENPLGYILGNLLGFTDSMMEKITKSDKTPKAKHAEDILKSYSFNSSKQNALEEPEFKLYLDMEKLSGSSSLNELNVTLGGKTLTDGTKTLSSAKGELSLNILKIKASFNATLKNVETGNYVNSWNDSNKIKVVTGWKSTSTKQEEKPVVSYWNQLGNQADKLTNYVGVTNHY